jgi:hypothetical protein
MVKWKGRAASMAPHIGGLASGISLPALATAFAVGSGLALTGSAAAQTLSGTQTTTQTLTGQYLVVTTDLGFSVDAATGDGVVLAGKYELTFSDLNASSITGHGSGLNAYNNYGALSITTTGVVTGATGDGIVGFNYNGTDLTISAASVLGGGRGIYANNQGSGAMTITTTGEVSAANGEGIYAKTDYDGTLTGDLTITATGDISATNGDGIHADSRYGGGLTISAAAVAGGHDGIEAQIQYSSGGLSITTTGDVSGAAGDGIHAYGYYAGDLSISADTASGTDDGIEVISSYGQGAISVTATGDVSGTTGDGIRADSQYGTGITISAATVSGGARGVAAKNYSGGSISITTTREVSAANGDGIQADNSFYSYTGDVTITAMDDVSAVGGDGIHAYNHLGTGLTISATSVSGSDDGIFAHKKSGYGALSITTTGSVTGATGDGIHAYSYDGEDITISADSVAGGDDGIEATGQTNFGALSITATGDVSGTTGEGIRAVNNGRT